MFLMMVLMLGSNGLYCAVKLYEAEKDLLVLAPPLKCFWHEKTVFLPLLGS